MQNGAERLAYCSAAGVRSGSAALVQIGAAAELGGNFMIAVD